MKNVLVTAIGSFSADITIKELKKNGFFVVGCDIYAKELIVDSQNVDVFYQAPLVINEEEYRNFILNICKKHNINYIIPLTDIEVDFYNNHRDLFDNQTVCISDKKTIDLCRDKYEFQEFVKKLDYINEIETKSLDSVNPNELDYPIVCKKVDGRSSEGLHYFYNSDELNAFIKNNEHKCIVEPFIDGKIITVDVVRDRDGNTVSIPREELIRTKNGAGLSVYVFNDDELRKKCNRLANDLNILGCVNFEFIKNGDDYYIIECNPRFSGGIEFSCLSGYNMIINHINGFVSKIDKDVKYKNQYIARKYEEYITKIESE
jgi:carbamoyl-phosphate synthase large subunit